MMYDLLLLLIGQGTLTEIPEGYEPRHYEYYKVCCSILFFGENLIEIFDLFQHPLRRFMARYVVQPFDERYEISLHAIYTNVMRDRLK
jgi:hypothetical protein